jgi:tetratricopeptide (TPR) repeat protein
MKTCLRKSTLFLMLLTSCILAGCGLVDTIKARQAAREGNSLYRESDYRSAIQKYQDAIALDPETPNVYLNLGYSYFSIYDPASEADQDKNAAKLAVEAFEKHLERNPEDENARVFQIKILLSAAPNDKELADRAHTIFLGMLKKNPNDHEARQYLITLFIDGRRYEDALAFFQAELDKDPKNIETMKILAIIADKSDKIQEAVDWYLKRAETTDDPEKKAVLLYEVGTYAWNLLHYQPDKVKGADAIKLADQGLDACLAAISMKEKYAEAMVYANLLWLKRALYETEEVARTWDYQLAFELRVAAGKIMMERKKQAAAEKGQEEESKETAKKEEEKAEPGEDTGKTVETGEKEGGG